MSRKKPDSRRLLLLLADRGPPPPPTLPLLGDAPSAAAAGGRVRQRERGEEGAGKLRPKRQNAEGTQYSWLMCLQYGTGVRTCGSVGVEGEARGGGGRGLEQLSTQGGGRRGCQRRHVGRQASMIPSFWFYG